MQEGAIRRIINCRSAVMAAGLRPVAVECGHDVDVGMVGMSVSIFGLPIRFRSEPGVAVLALPPRKIGRYEVVCPARFEEAA